MKASYEKLIKEDTSPLFRIMAGYDISETGWRRFENSITAFHIGNGYFLSVAHALIPFNNIPCSMSPAAFDEFVAGASLQQRAFIHQHYALNQQLGKHRWDENMQTSQALLNVFREIDYDTRYPNLYSKGVCKPYLLAHFKANAFLGDAALNNKFSGGRYFLESDIDRHTFLIDLKLHKIIVEADAAIYKIADDFADIIPLIPKIDVDLTLREIGDKHFYLLQSAPINALGRMLHNSQIEGYIDHYSNALSHKNRNYIFEGTRYLVKGYFRFGSSGAPYLHYDPEQDIFKANAIQSEACPLQMLIQGNRDNSAQYVNAIATPLHNIKGEIEALA